MLGARTPGPRGRPAPPSLRRAAPAPPPHAIWAEGGRLLQRGTLALPPPRSFPFCQQAAPQEPRGGAGARLQMICASSSLEQPRFLPSRFLSGGSATREFLCPPFWGSGSGASSRPSWRLRNKAAARRDACLGPDAAAHLTPPARLVQPGSSAPGQAAAMRREDPPLPRAPLLALVLLALVPSSPAMEVMAPSPVYALNGSSIRLTCTFNSCYQVEKKQFSLNWTYQSCDNCTEEMFLQFKLKIVPMELNRFGDRVEFTGNPTKNDVSFTLHDVQLDDEGMYHCYVMNPPDRHKGHGKISLRVITEEPPERDSTVAVIVGATVGGFLAVVILALVVVKCVRRKKQQRLNTDDQKTEEEGKTDGEGNPEEGAK